jgi:FkbM family methyltransferase
MIPAQDFAATHGPRPRVQSPKPEAAQEKPIGACENLLDALRLALAQTNPLLEVSDGVTTLHLDGHDPIKGVTTRVLPGVLGWPSREATHEEGATIVTSKLIELLRPKVFFDIGACRGYFSRLAASARKNPPAVHAFEMRRQFTSELKTRLATDSFGDAVKVHEAGVSDRYLGPSNVWIARTMLFEARPEAGDYRESWYNRLKHLLRGDFDRAPKQATITVTSIDHIAETTAIAPDLIKIDVDGYEANVLKGAQRVLAESHPLVLLELHADKKLRTNAKRSDIVKRMTGLGYKAIFLTDHHDRRECRLIPVDAHHPLVARQQTDMLLFIHPDRLEYLDV